MWHMINGGLVALWTMVGGQLMPRRVREVHGMSLSSHGTWSSLLSCLALTTTVVLLWSRQQH